MTDDDEWFAEQATAAVEAALNPTVPHDPVSVVRAMMSVAYPTILVKDEDRAVDAIFECIRVEIRKIGEAHRDAADAPIEVFERAQRLLWLSTADDVAT